MYGNDRYPDSKRMYSRPFACYFQHLSEDKERNAFRETLLDVGEDIISDFTFPVFDLDAHEKQHYFSTPFWNEEKINKFAETKAFRSYLNGLSEPEQKALLGITEQIKLHGYHGKDQGLKNDGKYDLEKLYQDFKTLWEHDPMLDPRLTAAEEFFFNAADNVCEHYLFKRGNAQNQQYIKSNLQWMSQPENAHRIATMFLYSRLAQHFGETDPHSWQFALNVATDIREKGLGYVLQHLTNDPERYYYGFSDKKKDPFRSCFDKVSNSVKAGACAPFQNIKSLKDSASAILYDYNRLYEGTWAKVQFKMVDYEIRKGSQPAQKMPEIAKSDYWKNVQPVLAVGIK